MPIAPHAQARAGRIAEQAARLLAWAGGIVLTALAAMTVVSIIGRWLNGFGLGPVPGDYELVANGSALAIFAFLPWCQLKRGHVTVDLLAERLPPRAFAALGLLGDALLTLAGAVILRQLWFGFGEKLPFGSDGLREFLGFGYKPFFAETTYELQIPVWIPYGFAVVCATVFVLVGLFTMWRALNWVLAGQEQRP